MRNVCRNNEKLSQKMKVDLNDSPEQVVFMKTGTCQSNILPEHYKVLVKQQS